MNKLYVVLVATFSFLFSACKQAVVPSADYMILDEVVYVDTFPVDFINGDLYALNYNMEEMYKYDFKEILEKLNGRKN